MSKTTELLAKSKEQVALEMAEKLMNLGEDEQKKFMHLMRESLRLLEQWNGSPASKDHPSLF